jgi:phage terminase large subunit-like protein
MTEVEKDDLRRRLAAPTKEWTRNRSDELAVANGCLFDPERGKHVVNFIETYLRLYEGEQAGEPMRVLDWQYEATMRIFSWIRWSDHWNRWIRRFRRASIWVAKKNKKSPTLAAWALYLTVADGESGAKVFIGAKDGAQARENVGKHVLEMLLASPALMAECEGPNGERVINKNLMQITHAPSRSLLKPISSSDAQSQKAKEGLNASIMIDETHVCDQRFIDIVRHAGASRSEPLHIEVSTAGNDPQSYGKSQYDRGKLIELGTIDDQGTFFLCHEAPQDLSDEELAKDPVRYGKMANPAWGHTINKEEFLDAYETAKHSITDLANFKMYRLNIWQHAASPAIRAADWAKCYCADLLERVQSLPCWAGLDIAMKRDFSALVLVFREDDDYYLLPYFWLPEATARERNHLVKFLDWGAQGSIELTPAETCDDVAIRRKFISLSKEFDIRELVFDPWHAERPTQAMVDGISDVNGVIVEEGTGIPRIEFKQTKQNYVGVCDEFEKAIIEGRMHHPGHPVLSWQAGHITWKQDDNRNKFPAKPKFDDIKTIDGIVAAIMGFARAMRQENDSVYNRRGLITI